MVTMKPDVLEERNDQIVQLWLGGMSIVALAREYVLPLPRVISLLRDRGVLEVKVYKTPELELTWHDLIRVVKPDSE